jgi:transketolase
VTGLPASPARGASPCGPRKPSRMVDVFSDVEIDTALATNPAGVAIAGMADANPKIVTLTADLGAVLADFRERHPERYLELGIAETNSVSVAAGLATCGYLPYIFSMAPFGVLKCAEQIRTDLAYNHLPVRLVGRLTGLAMGLFGTSHHAVEDVAVARALTNLTVIAPADSHAVLSLMRSTEQHQGPIYIRISEGAGQVYAAPPTFDFGRWLRLREGADVSLIGHGMGVGLAVRAADELAAQGVHADVYDAAFLKPFDRDAIVDTARRTGAVLTIEDHSEVGGLGSIVAETLGRDGRPARLAHAALPDEDLEVGVPADLYEHYRLTPDGVVARAVDLLSRRG